MSRIQIAVPLGLLGFFVYVALVLTLSDRVLEYHWLAQGVFFLVAGTVWAWPAHRLILWAGGKT